MFAPSRLIVRYLKWWKEFGNVFDGPNILYEYSQNFYRTNNVDSDCSQSDPLTDQWPSRQTPTSRIRVESPTARPASFKEDVSNSLQEDPPITKEASFNPSTSQCTTSRNSSVIRCIPVSSRHNDERCGTVNAEGDKCASSNTAEVIDTRTGYRSPDWDKNPTEPKQCTPGEQFSISGETNSLQDNCCICSSQSRSCSLKISQASSPSAFSTLPSTPMHRLLPMAGQPPPVLVHSASSKSSCSLDERESVTPTRIRKPRCRTPRNSPATPNSTSSTDRSTATPVPPAPTLVHPRSPGKVTMESVQLSETSMPAPRPPSSPPPPVFLSDLPPWCEADFLCSDSEEVDESNLLVRGVGDASQSPLKSFSQLTCAELTQTRWTQTEPVLDSGDRLLSAPDTSTDKTRVPADTVRNKRGSRRWGGVRRTVRRIFCLGA